MLWYKFWLETRWRFIIGLVVLICSAGGSVFSYPLVVKLLPVASHIDLGNSRLAQEVAQAVELSRTFGGYIWMHWFQQNFIQLWTLFAILIGSGGLVTRESGGSGLFTLSLPVSRERMLVTRVLTGLAELLVLSFVPALLIPLLSPAIGQSYGVLDALVYATCVFVAGAVFFCGAILLSTEFPDLWRPLLFALGAAMFLGVWEQFTREGARFGVFHLMSAEVYFRGGSVPWIGLAASAMVSAALLYRALVNFERRDF